MYQLISLEELSLSFSNKICFEDFTNKIFYGEKIAIIGRNGSGKSSLLKILCNKLKSSDGNVIIPEDLKIGYVEQTISDFDDLSGGQRLNKKLSEALALNPDLLLLDEPTNHLDSSNRKSLMRMLQGYQGALIVVSHDTELLRKCINTLWHIDNHKIMEFHGSYDNYMSEIKQKRYELERDLNILKRDKKDAHNKLMQEQKRASKSKSKGKKKYY